MFRYTRFETRFCEIVAIGSESGLTSLRLLTGARKQPVQIDPAWRRDDAAFTKAERQISEYFRGGRKTFSLALDPRGTLFQKRVWAALREIPYGETRSYKDIAAAIGNPNAARAVGAANAKNPIPIIIPCHRVVGADGRLTGFALGLEVKERLLRLETEHSGSGARENAQQTVEKVL